jgi:hypothetical protein
MASRAVSHQTITSGTTIGRTASRTRTIESVESVMARIRTGPSPIAGFTKDGIQKMATAEADGYAFSGERQKR